MVWLDCQCLVLSKCAQTLMHAVAHWGCTNTNERLGRKIPGCTGEYVEPVSVLRLALWSNTLRTKPSPGFTLTSYFRYFSCLRSACARKEMSNWSDILVVVWFDCFSKQKTHSTERGTKRERERECVLSLIHISEPTRPP